MRIRRAANEAEQRRVVRVRELALGKTQRATKADGDQTRAQCMRHRLAQTEVRGNREGSNQLRESQAIGRIRCHEAIVRLSLCFIGRSPDARRANGFRYCDHGGHAMFSTMSIVTQETLSRVTRYALAVLLLTSVHHAYGAFAYHTPWRLDAVFLSAFAAAAIISSLVVIQRNTDETVREIAFWVFTAVVLVVPVALIGLFEGAYNHALKNALYFAGASSTLMNRLFPPPTYELPNDVFFEATGVMQAVLGSITAWLLYRLVRSRFGRIVVAPKDVSLGKRIQARSCVGTLGQTQRGLDCGVRTRRRSGQIHSTESRCMIRPSAHGFCVRTVSHTAGNPGQTPSFTGTRRCTPLLQEVVDGNCVGGNSMCVSTRGRNRFPSVLLKPLGHLSV